MSEAITQLPILFIVGLTGVGKSSTLNAVRGAFTPSFTLLPNRRELADTIIIPEQLRASGRPVEAVTDRLERFALTAGYRKTYPGGMVHALVEHLTKEYLREALPERPVFDNIRGLDESRAALQTFSNARFIVLDAPPLVRLKRLVGRSDTFDNVSTVGATRLENTPLTEQLLTIKGVKDVFDLYALARLEATSGLSGEAILSAVRIIVAEQQNYDSSAACRFLESHLDATRLLYLGTSDLSLARVASAVEDWL